MCRTLAAATLMLLALGCSGPQDDFSAASAASAGVAAADTKDFAARRDRIARTVSLGQAAARRLETTYLSGTIGQWLELDRRSQEVTCMFPLSGEFADDFDLCLAAVVTADSLRAVESSLSKDDHSLPLASLLDDIAATDQLIHTSVLAASTMTDAELERANQKLLHQIYRARRLCQPAR